MNEKKLSKMIQRDLGKFTVITTVFVVLESHILAKEKLSMFVGISPPEIRNRYNEIADKLRKKHFYHTYLQRHTKEGDYFVEIAKGKFALRPELIEDVMIEELKTLQSQIIEFWQGKAQTHQKLISDIELNMKLELSNIELRHEFILQRLTSSVGNGGQNFEIMTFSILKVYFASLGFSLRRFSTTFANDGGMDFLTNDAFYQVTISSSENKILADLSKLPDIMRVLVAPKNHENISNNIESYKHVLETITIDDLTTHFLYWLYNRDLKNKKSNYLQRVLEVAFREYKREIIN